MTEQDSSRSEKGSQDNVTHNPHDVEPVPYGVRHIEAISKQYRNMTGKIVVFVSIFLVAYGYGLDGTIRYTFQAYATASYSSHSLLATINTVRSIFGAAALPFIARLADVFGRIEIFIVAVLFYVVGTIIESQAYDVQRFAAGSLFYQFGYTGSIVVLQLMAADFSFLNWRVMASFVPAFPFIINTWVSGDITSALDTRWSWGIGMWAFIYPLLSLPLIVAYLHMYYRARKNGDIQAIQERKLTAKEHIYKIFWEMDLIGVILFAAALALFLIPFTLAGGVQSEWKKANIIVPLVIGFFLFPTFAVWEVYAQRKSSNIMPLFPGHMLKDRGVWSAIGIGILIDWSWYMQGDYLYTVLVVGVGESIKSATRITQLYSFVSVVTGVFMGFLVAYLRRLKGLILFGISMWFVAFGLLVHYRGGDYSHAGIIGAQCVMGVGAGFFTYPTQASIQTCTNHIYMGTAIATYLASYYVGAALGSSVSGAIWTQLLPGELLKRLGDAELATAAYGDPFTFATTFAMDTPERTAVVQSYQRIQKILCIVGLVLCVPLLFFGLCLRDREMLKNEQSYNVPATLEQKDEGKKLNTAEKVKEVLVFRLH
ncbi:Sit1p [Lipomyces tetrasporus]|uniref:Sit1p n=1 Tax=Lipomyces tetrasporus TaxID=54092 RepID=A0AAD7QLA9_9ASCO|nr:Sit1p [Lipomyces tetrasporus]KAJ8097158.1 Sit1p [Lipomyces tetrasporus]